MIGKSLDCGLPRFDSINLTTSCVSLHVSIPYMTHRFHQTYSFGKKSRERYLPM